MTENYRRSPEDRPVEHPVAKPAEVPQEREARPRPVRKPKMVAMKVANTSRVNVRAEADPDAEVVRVLDKDVIVKVDPTFVDPKFYSIRIVKNGVEELTGFIMKNYLVEA